MPPSPDWLLTPRARLAAAVVAAAGIAALLLQAGVTYGFVAAQGRGPAAALWLLAGFFTVLTNLAIAVAMVGIARGFWPFGRWRPASALAALTLYIAVVGLVYHVALARLWAPTGIAWLADQGLHTLVPILMILFWALFAPKHGLGLRDALVWLAYPLGYCAYALLRGAATGWYPYPFIDAGALGLGTVLANAAALTAGFFALGLGLVGLARLMSRPSTPRL